MVSAWQARLLSSKNNDYVVEAEEAIQQAIEYGGTECLIKLQMPVPMYGDLAEANQLLAALGYDVLVQAKEDGEVYWTISWKNARVFEEYQDGQ